VRGGDAHTRARGRILSALAGEFPASVVERHVAMLPERYLRSTNAPAVASHLRLIAGLEEHPLRVAWSAGEEQDHSELTVCARDAAGLFARLAGMLSVHNLNILAVDAYTREDGVVMDSFRVCESPGCRVVGMDRRDRIEAALRDAVTGARDVPSAVEAWRRERLRRSSRRRSGPRAGATVRFDDDVSPTSTIVEVGAEDELGLAYRIASTLSRVGLSIVFAKIASEKSRAWDVFYVTEREGGKLTAERKHSVESALLDELSGSAASAIGEGVR
jgi:[protein-PII] uridylyltransferase